MPDEQDCLHCALMRTIDEWGKDLDQVPVEDLIADLGEVAGHVMACTEMPNDPYAFAPVLQLLVQAIEEEITESSAGHTLQ